MKISVNINFDHIYYLAILYKKLTTLDIKEEQLLDI